LDAAEQIYEQDWKLAERLIEEALKCDPANQNARELTNTLRERKRRDVVSLCLTHAREREADGGIEDAVRVVEAGLAEYPDEIRLQQLRERYFRLRPDLTPKSPVPEAEPSDSPGVQGPSLSAATGAPSWALPVKSKAEDGPGQQEPPKPVEKPPVSKSAVSKTASIGKWKEVLRGRTKKLALGGAAVIVIGSLIWVGGRRSPQHPQRPVPPPPLATIAVQGVESAVYQIFDRSDTDVTSQSLKGLRAGNYKLLASRPGFQAEEPFSIDPAKEHSKVLTPNWKALPAELTYKMTRAFGALKVDDGEQTLDGNSEFRNQWRTGSHSIFWQTPEGDSLRVQFEVNDDVVEMQTPEFRGRSFVGIVAVLSKGEVNYQAINSGGLLKTVDGQSEALPATKRFSIENGKVVTLQARSGRFPLGDFATGQRGQPLIYVYLAPHRPAASPKSPEPKLDPVIEASPPQPPPAPPKDDGRKKKTDDYLKSLGIPNTPNQ
jgi:hypothetical protein